MGIVIAEVGENHCGDWDRAKELIRVAARSGADFVKFQLYDADDVAKNDPEREWFYRVQLDNKMWEELAALAIREGIRPLCTPWGVEKARIIHTVTPEAIKIASFHISDASLLRYVNQNFETVFISTGMATMDEIEAAVSLLDRVKTLYLLHCVSEYPLVPENVNLLVMSTLRERFGSRVRVGYSDHTIGIFTSVIAVAMGAEVIEKHITMSKSLEGTDHVLSADPDELTELVRQVRLVEVLKGCHEKRMTPQEMQMQRFMRERFSHGAKTSCHQ